MKLMTRGHAAVRLAEAHVIFDLQRFMARGGLVQEDDIIGEHGTVEVPDEIGQKLVDAGVAAQISPPPPPTPETKSESKDDGEDTDDNSDSGDEDDPGGGETTEGDGGGSNGSEGIATITSADAVVARGKKGR